MSCFTSAMFYFLGLIKFLIRLINELIETRGQALAFTLPLVTFSSEVIVLGGSWEISLDFAGKCHFVGTELFCKELLRSQKEFFAQKVFDSRYHYKIIGGQLVQIRHSCDCIRCLCWIGSKPGLKLLSYVSVQSSFGLVDTMYATKIFYQINLQIF